MMEQPARLTGQPMTPDIRQHQLRDGLSYYLNPSISTGWFLRMVFLLVSPCKNTMDLLS